MVVYVNKVLNNLEKNSTQASYVVAGDTDSTSYDSKIYVNDKLIEIGKVFDNLEKTEEKHLLLNGTEIIIPSMNLKTKSLNGDTNIKNISRHKVSKRKWEIAINNVSTYFTEDHSIMVYRNNEIIECKASEILSTDYLIIKD